MRKLFLIPFLFIFSIECKKPPLKEINMSKLAEKEAANYKKFIVISKHDKKLAYPGYNLYNPRHQPTVYLVDMEGTIVHAWHYPTDPNKKYAYKGTTHSYLYPNGDLLMIFKDQEIVLLDPASKVKWRRKARPHHDVRVRPNGDIYYLSRKDRLKGHGGAKGPMLDDHITVMAPNGKIKTDISIFKLLKKRIDKKQMRELNRWYKSDEGRQEMKDFKKEYGHLFSNDMPVDIFHSNSLQFLERDVKGFGKKDDILVSVREFDLVLLVDTKKKKIKWEWGPGEIDMQHHPTLLPNNNILIYDNGIQWGYSKIVELDPFTKKVVWQYKNNDSPEPERFFSKYRGSVERMPNGNTVITESDKARIFEVTGGGKIVWELNSHLINHDKQRRAVIYRMQRIYGKQYHRFFTAIGVPKL